MDELLKILLGDEKKVALLTMRYNTLKSNIANETNADKLIRTNLRIQITTMKKANAVIVSHYLNERILSLSEIEKITTAHIGEQN